jgi:ketosteroid isomerase-like protein
MSSTDEIPVLLRRATEANSALLRGDIYGYLTMVSHSADYTLMTPFGGLTRGFDYSNERLEEIGRFFESGEGELELVQSYVSGDLVVLVLIEHQHAAVGGLPDQDWSLRVTHVYRREGAEWRVVHRHADPLVKKVTLEEAAVLARGAPVEREVPRG